MCDSHTAALEAPPPSPAAHTASASRCNASNRPDRRRRSAASALRFCDAIRSSDDRRRRSIAASWRGVRHVQLDGRRRHAQPQQVSRSGTLQDRPCWNQGQRRHCRLQNGQQVHADGVASAGWCRSALGPAAVRCTAPASCIMAYGACVGCTSADCCASSPPGWGRGVNVDIGIQRLLLTVNAGGGLACCYLSAAGVLATATVPLCRPTMTGCCQQRAACPVLKALPMARSCGTASCWQARCFAASLPRWETAALRLAATPALAATLTAAR